MEGKNVNPSNAMMFMIAMLLVLGMFAGPATAHFDWICYGECFFPCTMAKPVPVCGIDCLGKCFSSSPSGPSPAYSTNDLHHHYCKIGCATSKCINISTLQDSRAKEVGACVDSCADTCAAAIEN